MRTLFLAIITALLITPTAFAGEKSVLDNVRESCKVDKEKFCSTVTPGNTERMLACAYAHEDQLSGQCSHALYQAAAALEAAVAALTYIAKECKGDVETHCASVKMGEGRILNCLNDNSGKISASCKKALDDTVEFSD